jgi:hypothetical protein
LKAGYPDSNNYSLYAPTEQSVAWEAMQLKGDGKDAQDMAIWRGEANKDTIQGTLTKQRTDKQGSHVEHFAFTGRLIAPVSAPTPPAAQGEPPTAVPAPAVPTAAPEGSGSSS